MELLLLRFGAAFLLPRLRDLRFADFLLGAAFLREARLLGAMAIKCVFNVLGGSRIEQTTCGITGWQTNCLPQLLTRHAAANKTADQSRWFDIHTRHQRVVVTTVSLISARRTKTGNGSIITLGNECRSYVGLAFWL